MLFICCINAPAGKGLGGAFYAGNEGELSKIPSWQLQIFERDAILSNQSEKRSSDHGNERYRNHCTEQS